jgi:hypothetical protein
LTTPAPRIDIELVPMLSRDGQPVQSGEARRTAQIWLIKRDKVARA